jgi:ribose/xylose/arabinose/galactoside ABC-type transport system permease subunit
MNVGGAALAIVRGHGRIVVLAAIYAAFSVIAPSFFGIANLVDIFHVIAPTMIVASGMALLAISGKLDISVGSIAYAASAIFAVRVRHSQVPWVMEALLALGMGAFLGAINGAIVVLLRVSPLIATLGTMIIFRGAGLALTDGGLVELPDPIKALGNEQAGSMFADTIIAACVVLAVHFVHHQTNFGRQLTAIGNSDAVARRIGIAVDRQAFLGFLISGTLAALAGVLYTLQVGVNTAKIGEGLEFTALAVIVVGGISLFGGRGNILVGVTLGSLMFQIIRSGLQHVGANPYSYRLVEGSVIFIAMFADALTADKRYELHRT